MEDINFSIMKSLLEIAKHEGNLGLQEYLIEQEPKLSNAETVTEDMTLPAVSDEEILKTEESPSEKVEDNAYSNAIIDAHL